MEVIGHYDITETIPTNSPKEAVLEFLKLHPGAQITYVEGGLLLAICDGCKRPIHHGDECRPLADATLCVECAEGLEGCLDEDEDADE